MKIYNSLDDFKVNFKTIVTIGTFDGVHIGHRYIINQLKKIAKKEQGESVLLTFSPHPRFVLYGDSSELKLIDTLEEKKRKLKENGLQNLIVQDFTKEFSRIKYVNFVRDILVKKLNVDCLVIGYDHQFGRNREGSYKELTALAELYNFKLKQIPPQKNNDIAVSSTKIRNLLKDGNIKEANKYLDDNFCLEGRVVDGDKIGRKIGYPTANISVDVNKVMPREGVYVVNVIVDNNEYEGMLNIGVKTQKIEVHIFNFNKNIYNKVLTVKFLDWIRSPIKFDNNFDLKDQLQKDEIACRFYFS